MQHDEVIWQVINHGHCSFKSKTPRQNFCRNPNNVTGLCNRSSCPLANSRYATIIEEKGVCYLMMKTIERAHTPRKMWEKVRLAKSYAGALEQIDKQLEFWPKFLVHKNKQRLTKITQYLIRCRKLAKQVRPALMTLPAKAEKREARREVKAQVAARLEASIEAELLARLHSGTYNDIYNFPSKQYNKVLDANAQDEADEDVEEEEEEEEEYDAEAGATEFVEGYEDLEEDDEDDMEDFGLGGRGAEWDDGDEGEEEEEGDDDDDDEPEEPPAGKGKGKRGRDAAPAPRAAKRAAPPAAAPRAGRRRVEVEWEEERETRRH